MDTCLILLKDSGVVTENESPLVALFSLEELNGPIDEMWVTFSGAWLIPSVCNEKKTIRFYNLHFRFCSKKILKLANFSG